MDIYSFLHKEKIFIPYTYLIKFKPTGQLYYGVSYANSSKVSHPKQLWNTYFTSSKIIHLLIEEYGLSAFEVQVRRTFKTAEDARKWELKVLSKMNAISSNLWFNGTGISFNKFEDNMVIPTTFNKNDNDLKTLQARYNQLHKMLVNNPKDKKNILKEKSTLMKKIAIIRKASAGGRASSGL